MASKAVSTSVVVDDVVVVRVVVVLTVAEGLPRVAARSATAARSRAQPLRYLRLAQTLWVDADGPGECTRRPQEPEGPSTPQEMVGAQRTTSSCPTCPLRPSELELCGFGERRGGGVGFASVDG